MHLDCWPFAVVLRRLVDGVTQFEWYLVLLKENTNFVAFAAVLVKIMCDHCD